MNVEHKKKTDPAMEMPKIDLKDVNIGNALQQFISILKLDKKVMEAVAKNEKGGAAAVLFLVVGAVAGPLSGFIFGTRLGPIVVRTELGATLVSAVFGVAVAALTIFITSLVATRLFKGKGTFAEFFRVLGLVYGAYVLNIIGGLLPTLAPIVTLVVAIWVLVVSFVAIKEIFKLDDTNAVLTIIVTVVAYMILIALAGSIMLSIGLSTGSSMGVLDYSNISLSY